MKVVPQRGRRRPVLTLLVAALTMAPAAAAESLTLDQAIEAALEHAPALQADAAGIDVARAQQIQGKASLRPTLSLNANVRVWAEEQKISLSGGSGTQVTLPAPQTPYEQVIAGLLDTFGTPTKVQDQVTSLISVTLRQPLTDLVSTGRTREALALQIEGAELSQAVTRRQVTLDVIRGYLQVHLAGALQASAEQAVAELDAELVRVDTLIDGGVAADSDRLRLQVARAAARQNVISARSQVAIAQAGLSIRMGRSSSRVEPAPLPELSCRADESAVAELYAQALQRRPELARLQAADRQAAISIELARARMLPSVSAEANYSHLEGQGLAVKDSGYIGLSLSWNVFEWGRTKASVTEAKARALQSAQQLRALEDALRLELESAQHMLRAAAEAQTVSTLAETQARESLRIESERFAAGDATATDVVTAEAALRETRDQGVATRFQCLLAWTALRAAAGDPLDATMLTSLQEVDR